MKRMKKLQSALSARQAKELDIYLKNVCGVSTLVLMENAGKAIYLEALKTFNKFSKVAILCGKGNNGGDGFVAARHLLAAGFKPRIFLAGRIKEVKGEAGVNLAVLRKLGKKVTIISQDNLDVVKEAIFKCDLIIDALLGVGLKGELRGLIRELIGFVNAAKGFVLSVDIPSGLDATSGRALGVCVNADKTVTFIRRKTGMLKKQGQKYCGKILVENLGLPL